MSLLSPSYNFDVVRGWPSEGACELDVPPGSGLTLVEGQIVQIVNASGSPTAASSGSMLPQEGVDTGPTPCFVVIEGNTANEFDALATGNVTLLHANNLIVQTTAFVNQGSLVPGVLMTVSDGAGSDASDPLLSKGFLTQRTGGTVAVDAQVVAELIYNNIATQGTITVLLTSR